MTTPTSRRRYSIGVDVGGTKILAVATDADDPSRVLAELEEPTTPTAIAPDPAGTPTPVDVRLDQLISRLRDEVAAGATPVGIGVGLPGLVTRAGVLRYGPNLPGVNELDLAGWLSERQGLPVTVDNDGNCAAWAEYRLGAGRPPGHRACEAAFPDERTGGGTGGPTDALLADSPDEQSMVFIGLGTGISCGLVLDGQLFRGVAGFAGEPGHMIVLDGGPRCACGRLGCWEALASGTALAGAARRAAHAGRAPWLVAAAGGNAEAVEGHHVSRALREGDPGGYQVAADFADQVALGLVNLVHLLDPATVVLGGSVLSDAELWMDLITSAYEQRVMQPGMRSGTRLVPASLGRRAGAVGAALIAKDSDVDAA